MLDLTILGGGFSGAACALHLLRDHPGLRARLTIIEPRATLGAGLAYSSPAPEHRTNVAAARMSVLPDQPTHFHDWLHEQHDPERDPASAMPDGRLYPARAIFGRYVAAQLHAQLAANPQMIFEHRRDEATGLAPTQSGFAIHLAAGDPFHADAVVLAVSHTKPDMPSVLRGAPTLLSDPWDVAAIRAIPATDRVLVVGTGLTANDVIGSLLAQGHIGPITALSRHGLLPRPRTLLPVEAEGDFSDHPETTAVALLARIRRAVAIAVESGRPWENIIDALRQQAPTVWSALDWPQRRILLRHLRTWWDVHRFQCAPQIDAALTAARQTGAVQVLAAQLLAVDPSGTVTYRRRGTTTPETLAADTTINCTGPGHRSVTASHPVLRGLAEAGFLQPDPAQLGIWVDEQSRVLRADGTAWPNLFVAGPLARGTFGELMGLPQVNLQPRAVAASLAAMALARAAA